MDDYICQDCRKEGNSADFIDMVCDECNGEVISLDEMREVMTQAEEVLKGGSDMGKEMAGKLDDIGEF